MFKRPFELVERFSERIQMGSRKKSKHNPEEENEQKTVAGENAAAGASQSKESTTSTAGVPEVNKIPAEPTLKSVGASHVSQSSPQLVGGQSNESAVQKHLENRASWYGSWKGKAKPVAAVARDSIPASPVGVSSTRTYEQTSQGQLCERGLSSTATQSPRRYMSGSIRSASKGDILPASTSNLSVVSDRTKNVVEQQRTAVSEESVEEMALEAPLPPDPPKTDEQSKDQASSKQQQSGVSGWFGWWSRPDGYVEGTTLESAKEQDDKISADAQQKPLPESPAEERVLPKLDQTHDMSTQVGAIPMSEEQSQKSTQKVNAGSQRSSWFWYWSKQQNSPSDERPPASNGQPSERKQGVNQESLSDTPMRDPSSPKDIEAATQRPDANMETKPTQPRKSTGWAFWSRESDAKDEGNSHKQVGEIAVEGTPSQSNPEAAQFNETEEQQEQTLKSAAKGRPLRSRGREYVKDSPKQSNTPSKITPSASPERKLEERKLIALSGKSAKEQPKQAKEVGKEDKNILLPDFYSTYSLIQQPSIWAQIRRLFVSDSNSFPGPHLHLTPNPPRIKKALAIGVHGFFPSPIYQKILGQPTGTSIRFSNCAAQAIKSWTEKRGYECEIEKVALEGEGLISERVDTLWKLLLNWIDHIRRADFILVACHSQGVPVAVMLVAKLIAFGCVSNAKIGICAMAGISLGPFAEYKTRMFGGTALELFDFADPKSKVSEMYRSAVEEVLKAGVRIVYVGSIDDQLVSLESSTFAPLSHPNIYRAVFIDGRLHTSDFLTQLIGFTLKLRNLGLPDHGLIRELSPALAGSLYSGEGHSTLHNYMPIYDLAVQHALETTLADHSTAPGADQVIWGTLQGPSSVKDSNPYFLPWAMRGVLEERAVRETMGKEVEELLRLFEEWKPASKGLKDIKFRLEAVRSKL
ncbi:uncharacterized protein PV09_05250 [Verruconis gallopava]|uniref:YMC020W-like alpha/beta hydrolase domain-containing protein n=1 Tax=Verruconis gallopava TaxID=253628 RepID=A0A0D2A9S7_9PEZI|nr:uncharacterized protein PV09_05250 [Verruconis gallopava]KIW03483.1 hypothetical protein PV09_05250 [Verruconis gallopava]